MKELENIRIRTGSNISSILQSTVNIPQAFTELVKNSIQNLSTFVKIDIHDDKIIVEDDGRGFDSEKDSTGKNDFDKYFVFGNSYDNTNGAGIRLGHMGIGGKLSNDKLSKPGKPNWSIHTKNKSGECFVVNYRPETSEFLDDYSPELRSVEVNDSIVSSNTGTVIVINDLNDKVKDGVVLNNIDVELKTFFGFLVTKLNKENKTFKIILNGNALDFDYRLPGTAFRPIEKTFYYEINGETCSADINFNLSFVKTRSLLKNHPVKGVEVISGVKVCNFNIENSEILDLVYKKISQKEGRVVEVESEVLSLFRNLIGFISCDELSSVIDSSNMPAKDLSHHKLREDHPVTLPFLTKAYEVIIDSLRSYLSIKSNSKHEKFDEIVEEITNFLKNNDEINENFLIQSALGVDFDKKNIDKDILDSAKSAASNIREFDPELQKHEDTSNWESRVKSSTKKEVEPIKEVNDKVIINYEVVDFGEGFEREMSRFNSIDFKVMINSSNIKFKRIDESSSALLMAMHMAECIIMEIAEYNNPMIKPKQLQDKISLFYDQNFENIKNRFSDV